MDEDLKRIDQALNVLMEHFDTVQIFTSTYQDDETTTISRGKGNYWARVGQIRAWVIKEDESSKIEVRKDSE